MFVLMAAVFMRIKDIVINMPSKQAAKKQCHLRAIKKNNMKDKNKDQDLGLAIYVHRMSGCLPIKINGFVTVAWPKINSPNL
ncbi:MAG: hypothetical protein A3E87_10425 [Gammaproteobacteria bacterium RIFCSPHIGHO2_12_FULL_35_23]|nr:MAG: hypothetical protein A3E87_10425 [Gammaproteobacteria bacterium RIFCSPHIGHO2_12_FULL_35_23]